MKAYLGTPKTEKTARTVKTARIYETV